jgi:hypothetical protein
MSEVNEQETELEQEYEKQVPVSESIRYRRRAQAAEKKAGELEAELAEARTKSQEMTAQVQELSIENKLITKLSAAGAVDIEAAVLLAKTKIKDANEIDAAVAQIAKEKPHLFTQPSSQTVQSKTASVKDKTAPAASALQRAARCASQNAHSRASLQEYMKLRRKF